MQKSFSSSPVASNFLYVGGEDAFNLITGKSGSIPM